VDQVKAGTVVVLGLAGVVVVGTEVLEAELLRFAVTARCAAVGDPAEQAARGRGTSSRARKIPGGRPGRADRRTLASY
jgi:hypothetical protein